MARKDLPTPSLSGVTLLNWHKADKVSVHAGTNITQMRLNSGFSKPKLVRGRALQTLLGPRIPKTLNSPGFTRFSAICHIHLFFEEYSNPWIERSLHILEILPVKDNANHNLWISHDLIYIVLKHGWNSSFQNVNLRCTIFAECRMNLSDEDIQA